MRLNLLMAGFLSVLATAPIYSYSIISEQDDLIENRIELAHKKDSSRHFSSKVKKHHKQNMAVLQLDFAGVNSTQISGEDTYAPAVEPSASTAIRGVATNTHRVTYNSQSNVIHIPPGIYSIRSCSITDVLTSNQNPSLEDGYLIIYYSKNKGQTWIPFVSGDTSTIEIFKLIGSQSLSVLFPPTEALVTIKPGESLMFAYGLTPVIQFNTVVTRSLSGRFILEQITETD